MAPSVRRVESYPVPVALDRTRAPRFRLINIGPERLRAVTVMLAGPGRLATGPPVSMRPGERLEFTVSGEHLEVASSLVVRWLRSDGGEYVWRAVF